MWKTAINTKLRYELKMNNFQALSIIQSGSNLKMQRDSKIRCRTDAELFKILKLQTKTVDKQLGEASNQDS